MLKILVADRIADEGLALLNDARDVACDVRTGLSAAQLADTLGDYDGMIIRSGVKVTADCLARPGRLRIIARAGVGVDNVDLAAATAAGILVMNTPDANTLSTAEHTIAMMLAWSRRIPDADAHVKSGAWDRKAFLGKQLAGKTLGIIGFGRVGRAVAERALSFQMNVVAFDPFVSAETAMGGKVAFAPSVDELLPQVDYLTLHASLTDDTRHLINADALARMKSTAVLINCARGGLIDEQALADALNAGRLAGAALDVFPNEPPADSPLLTAKHIVLTPHLGASTEEAQTAVSTEAVGALLDFLRSGVIRSAVNVTSLPPDLSDQDRAHLDLVHRMGTILSPLCAGGVDRVEVTTYGGEPLDKLAPTLALQALVGLMNPHIDGRLNLVNAESFSHDRGIPVQHVVHSARREFHDVVAVRAVRGNQTHEIEGTVFLDRRPRVLALDGYRMEMVPEGRLVLIYNDDRPGVIGLVGTLFGRHKLNIADMTLSRRAKTALMLLKIDGRLPDDVLDELRGHEPILSVRTVQLPPLDDR